MALAFYVDGPDAIARAFAAHDEYTAVFTYYVRGKDVKCRMLTPDNDNHYSAPYCFLPKYQHHGNNNNSNGASSGRGGTNNSTSGYLVFSSQVPWLHGNPKSDGSDRAHYQAEEWMKERGKLEPPHIGTVEEFQSKMGLREMDVYAFTTDGCYPTCDEISQALEDRAVEVTCSVMGWRMPHNWRTARRKMTDLHSIPILNLAEWDQHQRKRRMRDKAEDECGGGNDNDDCGSASGGGGRGVGSTNDDDDVDGDSDCVRRNATTTTRRNDDDVSDDDDENDKVVKVVKVVTSDRGDDDDDDNDRQEEKKDCSSEEQRRQRRC